MNIKPKISIIVPVYNVEKYLDRCIKSLLNQTLKDIEIILVDDGSPDNCPLMCDEYAKSDRRVKVVHKANEGLGYARNSGLEVATGEYIAFVDSDDYVELDMYERLYEVALFYNVQMVLCGFNRDNKGCRVKGLVANMPSSPKVIDARTDYIPNLIGQKPNEYYSMFYGYAVWNILFSADIINKHHIRFKSERIYLSEDILFQIEYAARVKDMLLYPVELYNYCLNSESLTTKYDKTRYDKAVVLYNKLRLEIDELELTIDNCELRVQRMLLAKALYSVCDAIKALGVKDAHMEVNAICNNAELVKVLKEYPVNQMNIKRRYFYLAIKYRCSWALVILYKLFH